MICLVHSLEGMGQRLTFVSPPHHPIPPPPYSSSYSIPYLLGLEFSRLPKLSVEAAVERFKDIHTLCPPGARESKQDKQHRKPKGPGKRRLSRKVNEPVFKGSEGPSHILGKRVKPKCPVPDACSEKTERSLGFQPLVALWIPCKQRV